jgi:hypothetical protein
VLDDFEDITGWNAVVSEGAKLVLGCSTVEMKRSLVMDFDLTGVHGYVVAEKDFSLDLPADYRFTFDLRGEAPPNNLEFKLTDGQGNVHWLKRLNVEYPHMWTKQRIARRQITFAWGPEGGGVIRTVRKIEFAVSCGSGGNGRVCISNFRFEPLDTGIVVAPGPEVSMSAGATGETPVFVGSDSILTFQGRTHLPEHGWLQVDFKRVKEIGGLVIDWDSLAYAVSYDVLFSEDGKEWATAYSVTSGNGGRDYVCIRDCEARFLKLEVKKCSRQRACTIHRVVFRGAAFSMSTNDFFFALASDAPPGRFPKYFLNRQSYWTVVGVNGDSKKALVNEEGQIEIAKERCSIEPFLSIDGELLTWNSVKAEQSLLDDYLPLPTVTWTGRNGWRLKIQPVAAGRADSSILLVKYSVKAGRNPCSVQLFLALRPFQVNPPWQALNTVGGAARVDSILYSEGLVEVNDTRIISLTCPSAFGAAEFDQGDITDFLARGIVPPLRSVHDHFGYASAALEFDFTLGRGEEGAAVLAVPFQRSAVLPSMEKSPGNACRYFDRTLAETAAGWREKLNRVRFSVPASALPVINTLRSTLAYIFINRNGSALQPGSRTYDRSWIRDGSLTGAELLRTGNPEEVREFIDWYARGQFPSGKIPCVIDARGPDPVPEHDSNGEFIYAVLQYFLFTHDTLWLRGKFDTVVKSVRYIQSLRAERKTETYRSGNQEQRALYGLVPQSISHEGYSDVPRHSYWDDFFIVRGLKDATTIARMLLEKGLEREFGAERDDLRKDLYESMRHAMKNRNIEYIPGCAELGDFDPTSTAIGVSPGGELGYIPEPALHNTFDRYYRFFKDRETGGAYVNYTPYETRVIGTFVRLGEKGRAGEALNFFMNDRRPPAWNGWAEVVWHNPGTPKFIGDMPHTWVGSEFIRSVLDMFVYEREADSALVLAAGVPEGWLNGPEGVSVRGVRTCFGELSYSLRRLGNRIVAELSGDVDPLRHPLVLPSPNRSTVRSVTVDGETLPVSTEMRIKHIPARIEFIY